MGRKKYTDELRVWVEVDFNPSDKAYNEPRIALANEMLKRLCAPDPAQQLFSQMKCKRGGYSLTLVTYPSQMFRELVDNGEWFNLEYFGRGSE